MISILDAETIVGRALQISIGIVIAIILYIIGISILYADVKNIFVTSGTKMTKITVLDGYVDSSQLTVMTFNTVLPFAKNYIPITPSTNMKGGAQFSYTGWMHMQNPDDPAMLGKCIFMRGDKQKYTYTMRDHITGDSSEVIDYMTYCPMLSFGTNKLDFTVKFNGINKLDQEMYVSRIESTRDLFRKNILSVLQNNWIMITLVFEDNIPVNDFENGVRVQMYINDLLYESRVFSGMLKQNTGNLYFFPDGPIAGIRLSTFKYYNYALNGIDIKKLFAAGPVTTPAKITSEAMYASVNPSTGNILDVYNV